MHLLRRPLTALFATLVVAALLSAPAFAGDREYAASPASVAKPASAKLRSCKSNAYYSGRQLSFRAKISRQMLDVPQRLSVRVTVYRRLAEQKKFRVLSREKEWNSASDIDAGIYQHDVIVSPNSIETRAEYKAKVAFRWANATTGVVEAKKYAWSKVCHQRTKLPKLRLSWVSTVQVPGEAKVTHTFTVSNTGASEALNTNIVVENDNSPNGAGFFNTDSIGPKQTVTATITTPACSARAIAYLIQPVPRVGEIVKGGVAIDKCS